MIEIWLKFVKISLVQMNRQQAIFLIMFDNAADYWIRANICLVNVWWTGHSELPTALNSDIRYNKYLHAKWNWSCQMTFV